MVLRNAASDRLHSFFSSASRLSVVGEVSGIVVIAALASDAGGSFDEIR